MSKKLPPLNTLRAFESAARTRSFKRAAEELHLTPAAISHQVKQLEKWLGAALFERSANGVAPTAAGLNYAQHIQDVFEHLIQTTSYARVAQARAVVTIRAQFTVSARWLVPRMIAFNRSHDDIEIRLEADGDRSHIKIGADLAIFHERDETEGYTQDFLLRGKFKLYAVSSIAAQLSLTKPTLAELMAQPMLHTSFIDRGWRYPRLRDWFIAAKLDPPETLPGLHFNLIHLTASACEEGGGLALLLDEFCESAIEAKRLVQIGKTSMPSPHAYHLFAKNKPSNAVSRVREYLLESVN